MTSFSGGLADVGESRCNYHPEKRVIVSERLYLVSPTMDVFESCGEKCANLCKVYNLIMVSRVPGYGHLEYLVLGFSYCISSLLI